MRFRLIELFGVTCVIALGIGALLRSASLLAPLFFSLSLCILLAAVLCAIGRRGEKRFFWIGFAVASMGYLWCVSSSPRKSRGPFEFSSSSQAVATTRVLHWTWNHLHPEGIPPPPGGGGGMFSINSAPENRSESQQLAQNDNPFWQAQQGTATITFTGTAVVQANVDSYDAFMRTGHSLWALLIGCVAGYFTRWVRSLAIDSKS